MSDLGVARSIPTAVPERSGIEPSRIVELATIHGDRDRRASGYLLGPTILLTARHAIDGASAVVVRSAERRKWRRTASPQPLAAAGDIALLRLDEPIDVPPLPPDRYGQVSFADAVIPCRAVGFPQHQLRSVAGADGTTATVRATAQLDGVIPCASNQRSGRLSIKADPLPAGLSGMSGSAVFAMGLLVGVLSADERPKTGTLTAQPITALIEDVTAETRALLADLVGLPTTLAAFPDVVEIADTRGRPPRPEIGDVATALAGQLKARYDEEVRARGLTREHILPVSWRAVAPGGEWLAGRMPDVYSTFAAAEHQRLVILGGSGSGKSVMAHQLAWEGLRRWRAGRAEAVPLILPLSAWNALATSPTSWITERIKSMLPSLDRAAIADLVHQDGVLPIFDGLDEMPEAQRAAALRKIADWKVPWVLTGRPQCLPELPAELRAGIVQIEQLPADAVRDYLRAGADSWDAALSGAAPAAVALLSAPLWVSLAGAATRSGRLRPAEVLDPAASSMTQVQDHLVGALVAETFNPETETIYDLHVRRQRGTRQTVRIWNNAGQAARWLRFLARHTERTGLPDIRWWTLEHSAPALLIPLVAAILCAAAAGLGSLPVEGTHQAGLMAAIAGGLGFVSALGGRLFVRDRKQATRERSSEDLEFARDLSKVPIPALRAIAVILFVVSVPCLGGLAYEILGLAKHLLMEWRPGSADAGISQRFRTVCSLIFGLTAGFFAAGGFYTNLINISRADVVDVEPESAMDPRQRESARLVRWDFVVTAAAIFVGLMFTRHVIQTSGPGNGSTPENLGYALGATAVVLVGWGCWMPRVRYQVARAWFATWDLLPWALDDFLADAVDRAILRHTGGVYVFRHAELPLSLIRQSRTPFTELDPDR